MSKKLRFNSPLYVTKRMNISKRNAWFIRGGAMLIALLLSGIICTIIKPGSFLTFYEGLFTGTFGDIMTFLSVISIYLLLSLAVTPAFKMKFWNIGAEGQAMAGCIISAVILLRMPASIPGPIVVIIGLVGGIVAGVVWAIIPTLFKIKFNTNETLFTLMMNYIATALAAMTIAICSKGGSQTFPDIPRDRLIISIGDVKYIPIIAVAILALVLMFFYLKKSKQGYELSVLGDSTNTARYAGMNIKKITIRTMIISGAIAGLTGFLLVAGINGKLTDTLVQGRGFTAVLISWLGHFNPAEIGIYSFVIGFLDVGTLTAAGMVNIQTYFSGIVIGLFILIVIIAEFFVRYQVKVRKHNSVDKTNIKTGDGRADKNSNKKFDRLKIKINKLAKRRIK